MSRSILVTAIYKNNKRNNRGLFDGLDRDMSTSVFVSSDMRGLIEQTAKDIKGSKGVKGFEVYINTSDSRGHTNEYLYKYNDLESMQRDVFKWVTVIK